MCYEIFKFEIQYRLKRPDTYVFFIFLFLFSLGGVDFVTEGIDLGPIKKNAPIVISKSMGAITGISMMIVSLIMGVPILRDFEYNIAALMFVNPIRKRDYLLGRFLGSFAVLLFAFSGLLLGFILGEFMPWHQPDQLLPFSFLSYLQTFSIIVLPLLFLGAALFFVSGALSRKLIVVYTQGIFFFVFFMLTKAVKNEFAQALLDPFSLSTITKATKFWSVAERNSRLLPLEGILLYNKLFWIVIGCLVFMIGYYRFNFNLVKNRKSKKKKTPVVNQVNSGLERRFKSLDFTKQENFKTLGIQLIQHTLFHFKAITKEVSFWAIAISGMVIILVNSVNLGTVYGVDSYPKTYFIVKELQEMSIYFFIIILVFYSGELIWKERDARINLIYDATPLSDFINLSGKFISLLLTYGVLILSLILSGIIFQTASGYYHYELPIYCYGFFLEIFPFLVLYTFVSFFIQVMVNRKFISYVLVLSFFIVTIIMELLGFGHDLFKFGGSGLGIYSDMNGYGHFLWPYFWINAYWLVFCMLLFIVATVFLVRGTEINFKKRWQLSKQRWTKSSKKLASKLTTIFIILGIYIFYNTNILNTFWTTARQQNFRAAYEQSLKKMEHQPQPKIVAVNLNIDLYPANRDYSLKGHYLLVNPHPESLSKIIIQKKIDPQIRLTEVTFEGGATLDPQYSEFDFYQYLLEKALEPGDSIKMEFKQTFTSNGFEESGSNTNLVYNGTFLNNNEFPSIGYKQKYELRDKKNRKEYGLSPTKGMAKINNPLEIKNGRSGGDGSKINFEITIGTASDQMAIAPGVLQNKWTKDNRNYFHYKMDQPMVNFYPIVSARYKVLQDHWTPPNDRFANPVGLEIYYHQGHEYNLDRMMEAMKLSLDYFSSQFSPYPYSQMRIVETPAYAGFAQSFPNTIAFSEAMGFVLDIDDKKDVDMAFYITAHELAHQWWGLQVVAANVEGRHMILESLAQYSALMVLRQKYSEAKVQQFLEMELEAYFKGRLREKKQEPPLATVEKQDYISYRKGSLNLYALQSYISEDSLNLALKRFVQDWNAFALSKNKDRYATTEDLLSHFRAVTPDSLQYLIGDLFEKVIRFDNKIVVATYTPESKNQYRVKLTLDTKKYLLDDSSTEAEIPINDWIDIGIYTQGSEGEQEMFYLKPHQISKDSLQLELLVDRLPVEVCIDPFFKLLDKNREDNKKIMQ